MTPFLIVLSFYRVGTRGLNILLSITNPDDGEQPKYSFTWDQLRLSSDVIYNWGYGNWEGNGGMNALNFWFYIHTGIFIGLVIFNLLIAIISGTYVIDMWLEMVEFLKFLKRQRKSLLPLLGSFHRDGRARGID